MVVIASRLTYMKNTPIGNRMKDIYRFCFNLDNLFPLGREGDTGQTVNCIDAMDSLNVL